MLDWDTPEDAFKELDRLKEERDKQEAQQGTNGLARNLGDYRDALVSARFSRREAMRLVQYHAKFLYDLSLQDKMSREADDRLSRWVDDEDDND